MTKGEFLFFFFFMQCFKRNWIYDQILVLVLFDMRYTSFQHHSNSLKNIKYLTLNIQNNGCISGASKTVVSETRVDSTMMARS